MIDAIACATLIGPWANPDKSLEDETFSRPAPDEQMSRVCSHVSCQSCASGDYPLRSFLLAKGGDGMVSEKKAAAIRVASVESGR